MMSILETFYILFKSDASEVKKGAEEAEKSTKRLDESLRAVNRDSENVGHSFLRLAKSAAGAFGAIVSVGAVFSGLKHAINSVQELGDVSRELGVNVEQLDAWGHAVQRTGGTAQGFQSTLKSLADHLNTTPSVALKALPGIADSFSKFKNQAQVNAYGKSLGIDQSTIYLLQQGRREVEATIAQQKNLGLVTSQDIETTRKFNNVLYDLGRVFQSFEREIALPALPKLTEAFQYLIEHKDLIKGALYAIGAAVAAMALSFAIANPAIAAVAVSLAAFALAYEDYQKFKKGAPSVIGEVQKLQVRNTNRLSNALPNWAQKLVGIKAPDYALNRIPSASGVNNQSNTVNVGDVTIQTNATNGQEVASSFTNWLDHLWQANSHFDTGVKI